MQVWPSIDKALSAGKSVSTSPSMCACYCSVLCSSLQKANRQGQAHYFVTQDVVAVNLVNQHGSEGILAQAFQEEAQRFGQTSRGLRLVAFDFHKQCGASNYKK